MLRAIDANLNRLGEGLRVLEDIARFLLNDASLTQEFQKLRHQFAQMSLPSQLPLLSARDVAGDVGREREGMGRGDLIALARANARRVEESLRVLEELSSLPPLSWDSSAFSHARFKLYDLEKNLLSRLMRREKRGRVKGLYVILDTQALRGRDELKLAEKAISGGAKIIQLRDKQREKKELLRIAQELAELCQRTGVLFIINDHLDLVLATSADGLHLGQQDIPLPQVRQLLPLDRIVGVSTRNPEQAMKAEQEGADYVAIGSIFPSPTKEGAEVVGLKTLRQVRKAISLPIAAIGGINQDNVAQVMAAGAEAAAVISAVLGAEDVEGAARLLVERMEEKR